MEKRRKPLVVRVPETLHVVQQAKWLSLEEPSRPQGCTRILRKVPYLCSPCVLSQGSAWLCRNCINVAVQRALRCLPPPVVPDKEEGWELISSLPLVSLCTGSSLALS